MLAELRVGCSLFLAMASSSSGRGDPHLASVRIKVARQRELRHVLGPEGLLANQEELQHHARIIVDRVLTKLTGTDFNHGQYDSILPCMCECVLQVHVGRGTSRAVDRRSHLI